MLSTAIWTDQNGLVYGRLACTSCKKPEILNNTVRVTDMGPTSRPNISNQNQSFLAQIQII